MPDESSSLERLRKGDRDELARVFDEWGDRLYRLALGLLHDETEAEDVVQTTFLSALTHLDQFEGRSRLGTWLYRVAYNASLDRLRRRQRQPISLDDEETDLPPPVSDGSWGQPERQLLRRELQELLDAGVDALPPSQRAVFLLRDVEGLSTTETAEALGLTPGAVKVRLHRARQALRNRLAPALAAPVRQ